MKPLPARYAGRPAVVVAVDQSSTERDYVWILHRMIDETIGIECVGAGSVVIVPYVTLGEAGAVRVLLDLEERDEAKEGAK